MIEMTSTSYLSLNELPDPPAGRTGWPWTEVAPQIPEKMPDGSLWPRVSIVTPSFNQARFIEETIRSVLLQGYPNLEYIIVDGGSVDGSVEVINKYAPWLTYWVSEPDKGQSQAINKGLGKTSGDVIAYLNADDIYLSGTIQTAVSHLVEKEDVELLYGDCRVVDEKSHFISVARSREFDLFVELCRNFVYQPTVFMRRATFDRVGYFDEELHFTMDIDYWFRAAMQAKFSYLPVELAAFRLTQSSKTGGGQINFAAERQKVLERFFRSHADSSMRQWQERVFAWNHYRTGSQFYVENEREMARRELIKGILLEPLSIRTLTSLLMLFDLKAQTQFFPKIAALINISFKPSQKQSFFSDISYLITSKKLTTKEFTPDDAEK